MKKTKLNPNQKIVEAIRNRLATTNGQCPCVPQEQWTEDTICPCKDFREHGECHCTLYVEDKD